MKTIKFSLIALLFIFFISCSEDKDTPPDVNTSEMLGEWSLENFQYDGTTEMAFGGTNYTMVYSGVTTKSDIVVNFKEDGTYSADGGYTILLSTEIMDYEVPLEMTSSTGKWTIEGDKLKFSDGFVTLNTGQELSSEPNEVTIKEITSNRMVFLFTHEEAINESGFENIVNVSGEYIFTR